MSDVSPEAARAALDSSDTWGQAARSACLAASFLAKAKQVGKPQSLQFVRGSSLKMSIAVRAIWASFQEKFQAIKLMKIKMLLLS